MLGRPLTIAVAVTHIIPVLVKAMMPSFVILIVTLINDNDDIGRLKNFGFSTILGQTAVNQVTAEKAEKLAGTNGLSIKLKSHIFCAWESC